MRARTQTTLGGSAHSPRAQLPAPAQTRRHSRGSPIVLRALPSERAITRSVAVALMLEPQSRTTHRTGPPFRRCRDEQSVERRPAVESLSPFPGGRIKSESAKSLADFLRSACGFDNITRAVARYLAVKHVVEG